MIPFYLVACIMFSVAEVKQEKNVLMILFLFLRFEAGNVLTLFKSLVTWCRTVYVAYGKIQT